MTKADEKLPLPPQGAKASESARKVERAMEVRESSSKARKGKPLAFPIGRMRT